MPSESAEPADSLSATSVPSADWRKALSAALFAFLLSRALVLLSAALAVSVFQQWDGPSGAGQDIRLFTPQSIAQLGDRALSNDAGWYASIVNDGYERREFDAGRQANWAFFPLHPLLWRLLAGTGLDLLTAGLILANALFVFGLFQAHRWLQLLDGEATATRGTLCIALFPTAYFFSLPWTESLFLALSASSLLAMQRHRWGTAAGINAFAAAARPTGILLSALLWWEGRDGRRVPPARIWLLAGLGTLGLLAFMALLWSKTGNPLAFSDIQEAWGRDGGSLTKHLRRWLLDPLHVAEPWNVRWINNSALVLALVASGWLWRFGQRGLALYVFFCVLLPWSTGTLISMARYVVTCVPVFFALAVWLRRPRLWVAWLVVSATALASLSAWHALGANFAGT